MSRVEAFQKALESVILDPKYADLLAVLKGARNGAVYGARVRFPHALVCVPPFNYFQRLFTDSHDSMVFLFRSGSLEEKIKLILRATRTHAANLAKYATVYKATMLLLKHLGSNPGKEGHFDTFFAGLLGGYLVFGRRTARGNISSISKQIVIFGTFQCFLYCRK